MSPRDTKQAPKRQTVEVSGRAGKLARQRSAVAALKERQKVRLASAVYAEGALKSARVVVGGKFYDVRPDELEFLRAGRTPEEIGIEAREDGRDE